MPKKVDNHARRKLIAEALVRVAAKRGLEAVSLRHVAEEADVSLGMVQHYFRTKDEMMTFAMDVVRDNAGARMAGGIEPNLPPKDLVRALLVQLLPLDEDRLLDANVALAFFAYTAVRPQAGAGLRENTTQLRDFITGQILASRETGDASPRPDPVLAATALAALIEGLSIHVLGGHYSAEEALAALDTHLDTVFS
ncbi:TetR/AcrR family transcriptional regulator [Streptosporangium sp. KLBMP 9127]|nr:TetR family transcriptional regulator [Streptosporangium sp. KLBMP 9127]